MNVYTNLAICICIISKTHYFVVFHVCFYLTFFVDFAPNIATFYGNRAAAYMMMSKYDKALEDANSAIRIDNNFVKVKPHYIFVIYSDPVYTYLFINVCE